MTGFTEKKCIFIKSSLLCGETWLALIKGTLDAFLKKIVVNMATKLSIIKKFLEFGYHGSQKECFFIQSKK